MTLGERLSADFITACKNKDAVRLSVLRLLKTAISNKLVELKRPGGSLNDEEIAEVILKQAKQRKDSIQDFTDAKRLDLAERESQELKILEEYLPKPLNDDELAAAIDAAIAETQAMGPKDMGKVISLVMSRHKGCVDGGKVSSLTRDKLASKN